MRRILTALFIFAASVTTSVAQVPLNAPAGLRNQIDKYLFDSGRNPAQFRASGQIVVQVVEGGESLTRWDVPGLPVPTLAALDSAAVSYQVLTAPTSHIKRVGNKWAMKSQAELDADFAVSVPGVLKEKRAVVRSSLTNELRVAGFTNATYTTDDVQAWLETAVLSQSADKKISRLLSRYQELYAPAPRVDVD